MKINLKSVNKLGYDFKSSDEMFEHLKSLLGYLESHNKNYTNKQYNGIQEVKDIIDTIETSETEETEKTLDEM